MGPKSPPPGAQKQGTGFGYCLWSIRTDASVCARTSVCIYPHMMPVSTKDAS